MGKKIYVDGGILINTRYFTCTNGGALYEEKPEGVELLEPKDFFEGSKCLIIDDEHPQSIFNEYYARTFFSSLYEGAGLLTMTYSDCLVEYKDNVDCLKLLLTHTCDKNSSIDNALFKMAYVNAVTLLDSFICSIVLSHIVHNELYFIEYYKKFIPNNIQVKLQYHLINEDKGKWEQEVIKEILKTSFSNFDRIKEVFKTIGLKLPHNNDLDNRIKEHFFNRHLLVHRNGKMRDGKKLKLNKDIIFTVIRDLNSFVNQIMTIVNE
ncbi:MAG: hypothetical protein J1E58_07240 [Prevotella sp.]|nr:hypothetical protein [Prevotella sp.]